MAARTDPRYRWLSRAAARLYAELDDAAPLSLCLLASDGPEIIAYTVNPWDGELGRRVVRNIDAIAAAGRDATIDAAPGDVPGIGTAQP
jgi:hypothetical protein